MSDRFVSQLPWTDLDVFGQPVCKACGRATNAAYKNHCVLFCWNCGNQMRLVPVDLDKLKEG